MKRTATYGGEYNDPDSWVESSSQEYLFFEPGEKVPMLYEYSTDPQWKYEDPGKEMEIVSEGRQIHDLSMDATGQVDAGITIKLVATPFGLVPVFLPVISAGGQGTYHSVTIKTHVTCKVVRYPAIVKKVISRQDGIEHITENIGFDPLTGNPVATKTTDEYYGLHLQFANGATGGPHHRVYTSFSYPAAMEYPEMGQKASNEKALLMSSNGLTIDKMYAEGTHYLTLSSDVAENYCNADQFFTAGDLIRLYRMTPGGAVDFMSHWGDYHVDRIAGNRVVLQRYSDQEPNYVVDNVAVYVLRSGKTNQLTVPRAGITTYDAEIMP